MTLEDIANDPSSSNWVKDAARKALARDPLDVLADVIVLKAAIIENYNAIAKQYGFDRFEG